MRMLDSVSEAFDEDADIHEGLSVLPPEPN
jgi:hypothetical protein